MGRLAATPNHSLTATTMSEVKSASNTIMNEMISNISNKILSNRWKIRRNIFLGFIGLNGLHELKRITRIECVVGWMVEGWMVEGWMVWWLNGQFFNIEGW